MTEEMKKKIGERIKAARKAKGLSQEALGEKLEVSFQAVSSWETGKFIPDAEDLPQLSALSADDDDRNLQAVAVT